MNFISEKPSKWTDAEWKAHCEWADRRSRPKWPFDFKLPSGFSEPITRVKLRALAKEVSDRPWVKRYQKDLQRFAEDYRKRILPDPFVDPRSGVKYSAKKGPTRPYFEKYSEFLKSIAVKAAQERDQRMAELHPEPRPLPPKRPKDCKFIES